LVIPDLRDVFGNFLAENGDKYPNMVVLDADLSSSTRTYKFAKKYPERFFNMGIAEQNMVGTSIGLAISGKMPVISGFSIFTTGRAWEFIRMACHDNLNIKIITTHGGFVGEDGSSHNALEDISIMSTIPNISVLIPADNIELISMLRYAFENKGPFYIRIPRESFPIIHSDDYLFSIDKIDITKEGSDICFIGCGYCTSLALQAAIKIEKNSNLSIKVINLSCVKPINSEILIKELKNVKGIIVIEEHNIYCGVGSIIARILSESKPVPMRFIGVFESFGRSGNREDNLNYHGINLNNIEKQTKLLIENIEKLTY